MHNEEGNVNPDVIRSWVKDLFPLLMLVTSGLIWGMKLESRADANADRTTENAIAIKALQQKIDVGILPRAEERLNHHERRLTRLEAICWAHEGGNLGPHSRVMQIPYSLSGPGLMVGCQQLLDLWRLDDDSEPRETLGLHPGSPGSNSENQK